jgi:hypothetical protein
MKNRGLIFSVLVILLGAAFPCNAQTTAENQQAESVSSDQIEVYYFHFERRCATCTAVEEESEKALNELYPEKVKSGEIVFLSVNLEEKSNEALAEKLSVSGQTLLIVKGENQENLTNTAFMHARTHPDKLKKAIQKSIESI